MSHLRNLSNSNQQSNLNKLILDEKPIFLAGITNDTNSNDLKECENLLQVLISSQQELKNLIDETKQWTAENEFDGGIGFYNCKNLIFMKYLTYLNFYKLFKINSIDFTQGVGLKLYQKLVETKHLILKLAPTQKKLQYQTNKMLRTISKPLQNNQDDNAQKTIKEGLDQLSYKPRMSNIIIKESKKEEKYIPPKLSAVLPSEQKAKSRLQRQKERRKAYLVRKFRGDIIGSEDPTEQGLQNQLAQKFQNKMKQKLRIQEQNFVRLRQTKKQKMWRKQIMKQYQRGDQLDKQLDQIKLIRQIFQKEKK